MARAYGGLDRQWRAAFTQPNVLLANIVERVTFLVDNDEWISLCQ